MNKKSILTVLKTHPGHNEDFCMWCLEASEKLEEEVEISDRVAGWLDDEEFD